MPRSFGRRGCREMWCGWRITMDVRIAPGIEDRLSRAWDSSEAHLEITVVSYHLTHSGRGQELSFKSKVLSLHGTGL
jgi:hypothetical protein